MTAPARIWTNGFDYTSKPTHKDGTTEYIRADLAAGPPPDRTCPLGEDCDLTVAWMAGAADAKRETADLRAKLGEAVEALRSISGQPDYADDPWTIARATLARITGGENG
jgi:hypothetical protein